MEGKVNYTVVGIFVISLIMAIVLGTIWLSSGLSFERYTMYQVFMQESVSGMNIDSPVEYNGVQVGSVKKVGLDPQNPQLVNLLLSIKSDTPITVGTVATLQTRGLTGVTFIALTDKSADLRPLVALPGQPYPIIPTAPSLFLRIDKLLKDMATNFQKMTKAMETLLDDQNQRSLKEILSNMRQASKEFLPLVNSSQKTIKILENQTLPATYRLLHDLDIVSKNLADVSNQVRENPAILIRGAAKPPLGPGER